jgi:hypothetical protein
MNEHIRLGNEAIRRGDLETAKSEFYEASADPTELVQRIANNRLMDLFPETVYASTHSDKKLYHSMTCNAKRVIQANHIVHFKDWSEAEAAGRVPCERCKPLRPELKPGG